MGYRHKGVEVAVIVVEKTQFMVLTEEVIKEELSIINELLQEEVLPLIEYRKNLEKEIANKAIAEMYKLEQGV